MNAFRGGHVNVVNILLEHNANVNAADKVIQREYKSYFMSISLLMTYIALL